MAAISATPLSSAGTSAQVVYSLMSAAADMPDPVLVVGYGNPMKAAVKAAAKAGITNLKVTGTEDKKRAFSCSGDAEVVSLAPKFDTRLFSNDYAILDAIKRSGARLVLWVTPDAWPSETLLEQAELEGALVLTALDADREHMNWILHEPEHHANSAKPIAWASCPKCKLKHDHDAVIAQFGVCPTCHELYRLNSDERIALHFDKDSFEEWDAVLPERDPLKFPHYDEVIATQKARSGLEEAVRCGKARIGGYEVALCVMESTFMMGSMGTVVGEKITRTIERATQEKLPLLIFSASGGARMQEGLTSLMQMAKTSAAIEAHSRAGLLYISIITDPTTGGVTASFAMEGDIIISEPHAMIGFAGRRVIQDTIKQTLPDDFQTAEFALEHGLIDAIVKRSKLRDTLINIIALHVTPFISARHVDVATMTTTLEESYEPAIDAREVEVPDTVSNTSGDEIFGFTMPAFMKGLFGWGKSENASDKKLLRVLKRQGVADAPSVLPATDDFEGAALNSAWESVQLARNIHRPTSQVYIEIIVEDFFELHGDRAFADDAAIIGGIGRINGRSVTVIAQEKGADLKDRIARNFGCPQPEGYRKSLRLMRQAEKFNRPIVCLVDTQGAFCGKEAEERGVGNAIADNLVAMAGLKVPIISAVLGEGGSGGALALAVSNKVAMQEHAVYSVLSPEGFASILWKDRSRAAEAAAVMKMSAQEAKELGLIEAVLLEGDGPAHENPEQAAAMVGAYIISSLEEFQDMSGEELRDQRYARFRKF